MYAQPVFHVAVCYTHLRPFVYHAGLRRFQRGGCLYRRCLRHDYRRVMAGKGRLALPCEHVARDKEKQ